MRRAFGGMLVAALALGIGGACDDDETTGPGGASPGPEPYTLENLCDIFAERICAPVGECCELADLGFSEGGCRAAQRDNCQANVDVVERGEATFDPTRVDACLEEIAHIYRVCAVPPALIVYELYDVATFCGAMFSGETAQGDPCDITAECAPSSAGPVFCHPTDKVCVRTRARQAGESCGGDTGDLCKPGTYCDLALGGDPPAGTCQTAIAIGGPCDPADLLACGAVRYCDPETMVCTVAKASGQPCAADVECESLVCDGTCDPLPAFGSAAVCTP